jgi:hypothetical protein
VRRVRRLALASAALALAGCTRGSGGEAMLRPVCAPNDGAATELSVAIAAPGSPRFRLRVDQPLARVAGRVVQVTNPDAPGPSAQWCDANGCRVVRPGPTSVTFGALRPDSSAPVDVRTTGTDGKPFSWRGFARWHGQDVSACG